VGQEKFQRLGDSSTHGGATIEASPTTHADGIKVARVGDKFLCPIHGIVTHVEGSVNTYADGKKIACVNDLISCGALCTGASATTSAES